MFLASFSKDIIDNSNCPTLLQKRVVLFDPFQMIFSVITSAIQNLGVTEFACMAA
jgi:hypothetical protein